MQTILAKSSLYCGQVILLISIHYAFNPLPPVKSFWVLKQGYDTYIAIFKEYSVFYCILATILIIFSCVFHF